MDQTVGYFNNIGDLTVASLQSVWVTILTYLPQIIAAIIILIIGWIIAAVLGSIVRKVVALTGADAALERHGINEKLKVSAKYKLVSGFLGQCVKWFVIVATLIAVANSLNLPQITEFLNQVALYIPRVVVAVVILAVGMVLSEFVSGFITRAFAASKLPIARKSIIAGIAKYSIIVFSVMAALVQLNIVPQLIQILFAGLVLALALAFGLGGREEASRLLAKLRTSE